jgi:hypothetical protein
MNHRLSIKVKREKIVTKYITSIRYKIAIINLLLGQSQNDINKLLFKNLVI